MKRKLKYILDNLSQSTIRQCMRYGIVVRQCRDNDDRGYYKLIGTREQFIQLVDALDYYKSMKKGLLDIIRNICIYQRDTNDEKTDAEQVKLADNVLDEIYDIASEVYHVD